MRLLEPTALLDLDGTLTDPFPGISRSILYAIEKVGRPSVSEAELRAAVGPPLEATFTTMLGGDAALAREALGYYRERYGPIGLYENRVFEGIPEALESLRAAGVQLFVASSKPRVFCERIIEHFGLAAYFSHVHGSELDGRFVDKAELVAHVLEVEDIDRARCVMVGDRYHDVRGARLNQIKSLAVGWGYAGAGEFDREPPDAIITEVRDLAPAVMRQLETSES